MRSHPKEKTHKQDIVQGLRSLGLNQGDLVLVHSSLSSLGYVEGGADTVIDALLEVLGNDGTLLMPSFQAGLEFFILQSVSVFDLRSSPSELGIISETFRRRSGVIRSINPTHSVAGIGKYAKEILSDHQTCNVSVGKNSPFDKVVHMKGKILLLGVLHNSNTTLHLIENLNGAPTLSRQQFNAEVIDMEGKRWTVPTFAHMPGLKRRYNRVEEELLTASIQINGTIGAANAKLIQALPMAELIGSKIRKDPLYLCEVFTPN
jgi:aminoglycoside 3-N-acetyltransferase